MACDQLRYQKIELISFCSKKCTIFLYKLAPGNVSGLTLKTLGPRSMQVTWLPTTEVGNGIIGHKVLYNRQDKPAVERRWKVIETKDPNLLTVKLTGLSPNRPYEVKVYPRSKSSIGVPSFVAVATTLPDGKFLDIILSLYEAAQIIISKLSRKNKFSLNGNILQRNEKEIKKLKKEKNRINRFSRIIYFKIFGGNEFS